MGETYKAANVAVLLDSFNSDGKYIYDSFRLAGNSCPVAVIDDDGFLPEDVTSVYGFFLGEFKTGDKIPGHPRYFNQIEVPKFWEISGNNSSGKIHNLNKEKGRIFYAEPHNKRLVRVVDWVDDSGNVRISEHYNKYGALYARTVFNHKQQKVNKSYFDGKGREVIVENFVTGAIILEYEGVTHVFRDKTEFVTYFARLQGFDTKRLFFNSLSIPFFVSERLSDNGKQDVLLWQEPVRPDIPGNMQIILDGNSKRAGKIFVQKKKSYEKLISLGAEGDKMGQLGYIYPYEKENRKSNNVLILTNSDRIEHLDKLVGAFPELSFHIGALTEMSAKLMDYEKYDNVTLYPGIKTATLEELFKTCDWYFDINRENEIVSAVRRAFLNNHIIFAFRETLHNADFVAEDNIFSLNECDRFIAGVRSTLKDNYSLETRLKLQRDHALSETV